MSELITDIEEERFELC